MTSIGTKIFTWLHGQKVGSDGQGNVYYRDKRGPLAASTQSMRRERRWVVFAGDADASRIPPEWHAWLHHTTDEVPPPGGPPRRPWMKEHQPNATGTALAYRPPGHTLEGGARARATGDYEAWTPGS